MPRVVFAGVGTVPEVNMDHRESQEIVAPKPRQTMGTRRTAMRMMHRKSQGLVAVYEQDPTADEAGTRRLVFESLTSCTRLDKFPSEWQRLSDEELAALRRAQH
jgi:hypothetical protein